METDTIETAEITSTADTASGVDAAIHMAIDSSDAEAAQPLMPRIRHDAPDASEAIAPLEPLHELIAQLAQAALTRRQPTGYTLTVDLVVDDDGLIDVDDAVSVPGRYHRQVHLQTASYEPSGADAVLVADGIERALLERDADGLSLLTLAARRRGSTSEIEEVILVRQTGEDAGVWWVGGDGITARIDPDVLTRARAVGGTAGAHLIAVHAWSAIGYPRQVRLHVVPALASRLPVTRVSVHDHAVDAADDLLPWHEPVVVFRALTRGDSIAALLAGSDPIVHALEVARTTPVRATSRERAAAAALCQYVLDERWDGGGGGRDDIAAWVRGEGLPEHGIALDAQSPTSLTDEQARALRTIAALEVHGIGGPGGYSGDATARMSWAAGLGKGRRQASDGDAWTAAIRALAQDVVPAPVDVLAALECIRPGDLVWPMAFALDQAAVAMHSPDLAREWCDVARAVYAQATAPDAPYTAAGAVALGMRYGVDCAEAGR